MRKVDLQRPPLGKLDAQAVAGSSETSKRPYRRPELTEWGTLLQLTRGIYGGYEDAEGGGSQPF